MGESTAQSLASLLAQGSAANDALQLDEALGAYQQAVDLDGHSLEARLGLARALMKMRRHEEARVQLDAALEIAPDDPRALTVEGSWHFLMDDNATAIASLERAISLNDRDPEARVILAQALADSREYERSDQELATAQSLVEAMPESNERQLWLAMVWHARTYAQLAAGKNDQATASAQEVIALQAYNPYAACLAYSNLGILQMRQRRYDLAIDYLEEALALNPYFSRAGHALARLLIMRHRPGRAVEVMERVIPHMPKPSAGEIYTYAIALAKNGQRQASLEQHRKALASGLGGVNAIAARWQVLWLSEWGRYAVIGLGLAALLAYIVFAKPSTSTLTFLALLAMLLVLQRVFGRRRS